LVTITISQLAATASLRTEVLAGHGGTDRIVNWAHVCDRPNVAARGVSQWRSPPCTAPTTSNSTRITSVTATPSGWGG